MKRITAIILAVLMVMSFAAGAMGEENRIWQRFKNGQSNGLDYEALGGVMRDNVHAGGNVYLDGRTVGSVISDIQGSSYRKLQRSGWQS